MRIVSADEARREKAERHKRSTRDREVNLARLRRETHILKEKKKEGDRIRQRRHRAKAKKEKILRGELAPNGKKIVSIALTIVCASWLMALYLIPFFSYSRQ